VRWPSVLFPWWWILCAYVVFHFLKI